MEELRRRAYRRKLFNDQAGKLVSRAPALKDEVAWRVDHLNAKWELVEQIMAPVERPVSNQQDISAGNFLIEIGSTLIIFSSVNSKYLNENLHYRFRA